KKSVKLNPWKYLKVAAVIFPFIIAAVLFLFFRETPNKNRIAEQLLIEKSSPRGEKRTVFLSDGSKVKLNAESKISYLKRFNENERIVQLDGEAFFEVTPDKSRPFIVKSGNIETKVLGTSFNIKAYPDERKIMIAVKTGLVSVENKNQKLTNKQNKSIVLSPMEMATYYDETNQTTVSDYDPLKVLAWKDGMLYFVNATMEEFITKVERWYGVDIIVERTEPIAKGITGIFKDQSLEEILMGTKDASEFEYKFLSNGKVLIK
ncbi:MAG: FecR domain-containing protein, partial [Cyclobacteriaceae bacterium]|nr:FecR domain-containing protein [Cyclobacteriaceae bacterium]